MHSLKELRAQNAARLSRTVGGDGNGDTAAGASSELKSISGSSQLASAAAATASRVGGRTLAPLGSAPTGSSLPASRLGDHATTGLLSDDDGHEDRDRTSSLRRRRRRDKNRESEREDEDLVPGLASRRITANEREDAAKGAPGTIADADEEVVGRRRLASSRESREVAGDTDDREITENPLSTRGSPPQEKPKKKLTPLEARRARIDQQKREEVRFVTCQHGLAPAVVVSQLRRYINITSATYASNRGSTVLMFGLSRMNSLCGVR